MVQSDLSGLHLRSLPHSPWAILQNQAYRPPQVLAGAKHMPQFPVPFEKLKTADEIDANITRVRQERTDTKIEMANIDHEIQGN